jgi:hypothetical protein
MCLYSSPNKKKRLWPLRSFTLYRKAKFADTDKIYRAKKANPVHKKTLIENSVPGFIDFAKNHKI